MKRWVWILGTIGALAPFIGLAGTVIGVINAFALVAVIGDISRFANPRKLVAYLGLNPGQRESGSHKRIKVGIGRRGRRDMRTLLVQGAHAVLRSGRHTQLGKWGWRLFARLRCLITWCAPSFHHRAPSAAVWSPIGVAGLE